MPEEQDVNTQEQVQPEQDVNEQEQVPSADSQEPEGEEQATPSKAVTPPGGENVPYERVQQMAEAKRKAEQQSEWYKQQLETQLQKPSQPQSQMPTQNEFANLTPEEQVFYRNLDTRYEQKFQGILKQKEEKFQQAINAQQAVIGNLLSRDFRRSHPEIKKDSEEERRACELIQRGYDADDAADLALVPKLKAAAQQTTQQRQQQRTQDKKQANVEGPSIPSQSGLSPKKKGFRDYASQIYDEEQRKGWD